MSAEITRVDVERAYAFRWVCACGQINYQHSIALNSLIACRSCKELSEAAKIVFENGATAVGEPITPTR